jgi:hypothetical protein
MIDRHSGYVEEQCIGPRERKESNIVNKWRECFSAHQMKIVRAFSMLTCPKEYVPVYA